MSYSAFIKSIAKNLNKENDMVDSLIAIASANSHRIPVPVYREVAIIMDQVLMEKEYGKSSY